MSNIKYLLLIMLNFVYIGLQAAPMMIVNQASLMGVSQNFLVHITQTEDNKTISWNKVLTYGENLQFEDMRTVNALQITKYGKHQQQDEKIDLLSTYASYIKVAPALKDVVTFTVQLSYTGKLQSKFERVPYAELQMNIPDKALDIFAKLAPESKEVDLYPDETLVTDKTKDFLALVFPGLYYRGWSLGGSTPDSKTLAAYILGIPTPVEENDINGAFNELSRKWTRTRDAVDKPQVFQRALKLEAIKFILGTIEKARAILASGVLPSVEKITSVAEQLQGTSIAQLLTKSRDYLQTQLSGAKLQEALLNIMRGALVNYALVTDDQELINRFKANCKDSIKNLIWYYYALAIDKDQAFEEGTFIVQDTADNIFNLLRTCEGASSRMSSHFGQYLGESTLSPEEQTQFGLDIQGLPTDKRTLLFGKLDPENKLIFIKPESAGVKGWIDKTLHLGSLVNAVIRKVPPTIQTKAVQFFGDQDTPVIQAITDYLQYYTGSDDDPSYRKERIPLETIVDFGRLLGALKQVGIEIDVANLMNRASIYGIQFMYRRSQQFIGQLGTKDPALTARLQSFRQKLEQSYDHLQFRFGREVILLHGQELNPLPLEQVQYLRKMLGV